MRRISLDYSQVDTGDNPTASVIWMHGLGDHGSSFVPLVAEFDLTGLPNIRFIFPHAPERPVSVNMGYEMPAWFDIYGGFDSSQMEDTEGVKESQKKIQHLIEMERKRGVAADKIVLAGFSQGCAMALYTGLCHPEKLCGIIGLSGYLPLIRDFPDHRHPANQETPIFLGHGVDDDVVPYKRAQDARELLLSLNYHVEWYSYQMPHTLCMEEVHDIAAWLRKHLK